MLGIRADTAPALEAVSLPHRAGQQTVVRRLDGPGADGNGSSVILLIAPQIVGATGELTHETQSISAPFQAGPSDSWAPLWP